MAIRMTITHELWRPSTRTTKPRLALSQATFDVDLISPDEMEFPNIDVRAMKSAQALGLRVYDVPLNFYYKYTGKGGFRKTFLQKHMRKFYEALEEQGYYNFNYGDFSPEQLALLLASFTSLNMKGLYVSHGSFPRRTAENILKELLPYTRDREKNQDFLISRMKKLIYDLKEVDPAQVESILDELMLYMEKTNFTYKEAGPFGKRNTPERNIDVFKHEITVAERKIFQWDRVVSNEITDPIHFSSSYIDYCDRSERYCTPENATIIIEYLGKEESEYGEGDLRAPAPPNYPKSVKSGKFGVLYQRRKWNPDTEDYSETDFEEEIIVPYANEYHMETAIELSKHILELQGKQDHWIITPVVRDTDE